MYDKKIWADSEVIEQSELQNMEDGIDTVHTTVDVHIADTAQHLTSVQNDAIDNANAPTSVNPFATVVDISTTAPADHASSHVTGGSDIIADAVNGGNSGLLSGGDKTKLDTVDTDADATNTTNVTAAGAFMDSEFTNQSFTNLLENGNFESWSGGAAVAPDGWNFATNDGSVAREPSIVKKDNYSLKLTRLSASYCYAYCQFSDYIYFRNKTVTVGAWIYSSSTHARITISDGTSVEISDPHPGDSAWHFITVTKTISVAAGQLTIFCRLESNSIVGYFDGVILVEGSVCPAFSPKPLVDDGHTIEIDSNNNIAKMDVIGEKTSAAGVTIDGVLVKDSEIDITYVGGIDEQSFTNLLSNGDFESWSAGTSVAPDEWVLTGVGSAVAQENGTIKYGTYSAKITGAAGQATRLIQSFSDFIQYRGTTVTFAQWVYCSVPTTANIQIYDGFTLSQSSYHSGGGTWELLSTTHTVNASASSLAIRNYIVSGTNYAYFDSAILVKGSVCPAFSPKPLVDHSDAFSDTLNGEGKQSFTNILPNGNFESWSAGTTSAPDGWTLTGTGASVARDGTYYKVDNYSCKLTYGSTNCYLRHTLDDYMRYVGRQLTLGVWAKTAATSKVKLQIADDQGFDYSSYHTGGNTWEWLTVTRLIDSSAVAIVCDLILSGVTDCYYDGAILVEGSVCPAFSPKPLPNDGKTITVDSVNNRIGINDTTPSEDLDIDGNIAVTGTVTLNTTLSSDHTASGLKGVFTNGNAGAVAFGDVCYVATDDDLEFADADAAATMPGIFMALATINAAASGKWLMTGAVRDDTWTWTIGGLIYISTAATTGNTLTQTAPNATGDQVQIAGIALTADVMYFNPSMVLVEVA